MPDQFKSIVISRVYIFGKKTSKLHNWYEAKSSEMTPIIEAKHTALAQYKWSPTEWNLQTLRAARSKVQCIARHCSNEYRTEHSEMIQMAAAMGNIRGMYDGIKKALGPMQSKMAPPQIHHWGKSSQTKASRWRDGWNTILTSTPERTL